ncbi:MAG: DNA-binding protein [Candidatus Magasanikbacteria bacterium]|jgi:uncharacterized protein|nr:DNA-binding protein [Candidatus Magasanikbacteria bacterium]MBT4221507.1 DNA-binding protein [Candidatus Magasanikbacteria bacterium]MBT4350458.1 DNA-binding protein [Candidatus Magasanikbacteria bacterium]MBT4541845.1 DNA-binding protein [Candidatus Magasanikbacteria bacterium]MBT6253374.1 DNA-binding protein [Candidatus Magasanikbacteria bacterium]
MITHALRLTPGQDIKKEITLYVQKNSIAAGVILSCVGSLTRATLRLADERITKNYEEKFEIVSLTGTLSPDGCHLHMSIANKDGHVFGGHMKDNCLVYSTAEIVIGVCEHLAFTRVHDNDTGFKELQIK